MDYSRIHNDVTPDKEKKEKKILFNLTVDESVKMGRKGKRHGRFASGQGSDKCKLILQHSRMANTSVELSSPRRELSGYYI